MQRSPGTDAALQGAPDASGQLGVASLHLIEDGDRAQLRCRLQHRHDLALKEIGQRVRAAAAADLRIVRRQPVIVLEAIRGGSADRSLRRGHGRRFCLSELHVEPHLVIGDMAAGHGRILEEKIHPIAGRSRSPDDPLPRGAAGRLFPGRGPAVGLRRRVGTGDYSPVPLTEPYVRVTHTAPWIGMSEFQRELVRDLRRVEVVPQGFERG
jgi:hypothetical protein